MLSKSLMADAGKCTGCRTCEMACSQFHEGKSSPVLSRTRVIKFDAKGENFPTICSHCSKPSCLTACKTGAMRLDSKTGAVTINEALCNGCRACLAACPESRVSFHPEKKVAFKCDLCNGDPQCAKFCPTGAIAYGDIDELLMIRRRALIV
ncbi:MAG TPA: 4Fe-4S dicluster domain-containing protein [Bacillota bacterium]|nr:4Fe-4S dicluster domain-containing protein [Bacillota bacterium]